MFALKRAIHDIDVTYNNKATGKVSGEHDECRMENCFVISYDLINYSQFIRNQSFIRQNIHNKKIRYADFDDIKAVSNSG